MKREYLLLIALVAIVAAFAAAGRRFQVVEIDLTVQDRTGRITEKRRKPLLLDTVTGRTWGLSCIEGEGAAEGWAVRQGESIEGRQGSACGYDETDRAAEAGLQGRGRPLHRRPSGCQGGRVLEHPGLLHDPETMPRSSFLLEKT